MRSFWIAASVSLLLGASVEARAQVGAVQGQVVDENGSPVEDAVVAIEYQDGPVELETRTNARGEYTQVGLRSGNYKLTFTKDGYRGTFFDTHVGSGEPTRLPEVRIVSIEAARAEAANSDANKQVAALFDGALERADAGEYDAALASLEEALALRPEFPEAYFNVGYIQMQRERWDEAEAALEKALAQRPGYPAARMALSTLYRKTGRADEAAEVMRAVAESGTGDASVLFSLGIEKLNAQDNPGAIEAFLGAEQLDPDFAEVQYYLATLALGQGRTEEAIERLERYLTLSPRSEENEATARNLLAALKK